MRFSRFWYVDCQAKLVSGVFCSWICSFLMINRPVHSLGMNGVGPSMKKGAALNCHAARGNLEVLKKPTGLIWVIRAEGRATSHEDSR